eukprot:scaffold6909_cov56-Phaeocystis_antarctica.AAC.1
MPLHSSPHTALRPESVSNSTRWMGGAASSARKRGSFSAAASCEALSKLGSSRTCRPSRSLSKARLKPCKWQPRGLSPVWHTARAGGTARLASCGSRRGSPGQG